MHEWARPARQGKDDDVSFVLAAGILALPPSVFGLDWVVIIRARAAPQAN